MGFFAVLGDSENPNFSIETCHLNLWALGGLFNRHVFFWDVGLRISATGDDPVTNVSVATPCGTNQTDLDDLRNKMTTQQTRELIFGEEVAIRQDLIDYGEGEVRTVGLEITECTIDKNKSDGNFSLWNLRLSPAIRNGVDGYLRIRFRVRTKGRMWTKRRNGLFSKGALVDIRVSDVRETWNVKDGDALKGRIVAISNLYVFLILPSTLRHNSSSPPFKYVRILEGLAWKSYLDSASSFWKHRKMVVYYWKGGAEVNTKNPFRAFLDLNYSNSLRDYIIYSFVLLILFWSLYSVVVYTGPHLKDINRHIYIIAMEYLEWIIITLGISIVSILSFIKRIRLWLNWIIDKLYNFDYWILRKRAK